MAYVRRIRHAERNGARRMGWRSVISKLAEEHFMSESSARKVIHEVPYKIAIMASMNGVDLF